MTMQSSIAAQDGASAVLRGESRDLLSKHICWRLTRRYNHFARLVSSSSSPSVFRSLHSRFGMASVHHSRERALAKALALEQKILRLDDIDAMTDLGFLLLYDKNFASQRSRGVQMFERAIKQAQDPVAMGCLAMYLLRNGDSEDHRRAAWLFERSLKLKESSATLCKLAECYETGSGVEKNANHAVQLYERALRFDQDPKIMYKQAWVMLKTPSLRDQQQRALALFKKAIRLSSKPHMMNNLGTLYHRGEGNLRRCAKKAIKWYLRAIRTSNYVISMANLACLLLENEPSGADVQQAVRLLEDAMEDDQEQDVSIILRLAETYVEYGINIERAVSLYETAAIRFNSEKARKVLPALWFDDVGGLEFNDSRIFDFCRNDYNCNGFLGSGLLLGEMLWTGTSHVVTNRRGAIEFLASIPAYDEHCSLSLMLRHDLSFHPGGEKSAQRLMKRLNANIDRSKLTVEEGIILSEGEDKSTSDDKLLAMECFQRTGEDKRFTGFSWLSAYLRMGCVKLPFDGRLECVTNPIRRFAVFKNIASLNLASLLLEIEGKQQEAATVLEDLMNCELRLIAMLNLAYILMNDIEGVSKNWTRGMQLLEDAVRETNDASARAMLANSLSERSDSDEGDVERGWELWRGVEWELREEEEELHNVRRLVSASSKMKWDRLDHENKKRVRIDDGTLSSKGKQKRKIRVVVLVEQ